MRKLHIRRNTEGKMPDLRLWFSKTGLARFTSHLDTARVFARAVRMTDIDVWYTQGFNPHPQIAFDFPLPLGVEALREPVTIRLNEVPDPADVDRWVVQLNSVLPGGFAVVGAEIDPAKLEVDSSECEFVLEAPVEQVKALIEAGSLRAEKSAKSHGKKVMKTVELDEYLKDARLIPEGGRTRLSVVLPSGGGLNVSPALVVDAFAAAGIDVPFASRKLVISEDR